MPDFRCDIVEAYLFRRTGTGTADLLQLRRTEPPLDGTWQPVMGHMENGETAVACMWREVAEETGLTPPRSRGAWALEQVHPFFLAERDEIVLSPRFVVEVDAGWEPILNDEHDAHRWVPIEDATDRFLWPGQHASIAELGGMLGRPERLAALRLAPDP